MSLVSTVFGSPVLVAPQSTSPTPTSFNPNGLGGGLALIECSSRPNKKATSHHMKTRPRKTQPWDIRRKPTVYPPPPQLPPDWTLVSSSADSADGGEATTASPLSPAPESLEAPVTSG